MKIIFVLIVIFILCTYLTFNYLTEMSWIVC